MKQEITADIASAFDTDLADAVQSFTATRQTQQHDDWANNDTGKPIDVYMGRGIFSSYTAYEMANGAIGIHDVKLICLQSEMTDTPMIDDIINDMRVLSIQKDPANVSYTIQLRGLNVDDTA